MSEYHGHKTLIDGSHVPLTEDDAKALWKMADEAKTRRAEIMPDAKAALGAFLDAKQRMQELGWWQGGGLRVKLGDECAVAEFGSTGIWTGFVDAEGEYVMYCDCASRRRDLWLKPLAELTPDEASWLAECDRREAQAYEAEVNRYAQMAELEEASMTTPDSSTIGG